MITHQVISFISMTTAFFFVKYHKQKIYYRVLVTYAATVNRWKIGITYGLN